MKWNRTKRGPPIVTRGWLLTNNYLDWAKYQNRPSSKSIWVMKLFFCQNYPLMGQSFWQKNSFITRILFELCLFWYLAQSTSLWDTLYLFNHKFSLVGDQTLCLPRPFEITPSSDIGMMTVWQLFNCLLDDKPWRLTTYDCLTTSWLM